MGHPLCPITAVLTNFCALGPSAPGAQVFPMMGPAFNNKLKVLTSHIGVSSYSLCRGGAVWALSLGIPGVKAMGDWKRPCLFRSNPQAVIDHYCKQFAHSLANMPNSYTSYLIHKTYLITLSKFGMEGSL